MKHSIAVAVNSKTLRTVIPTLHSVSKRDVSNMKLHLTQNPERQMYFVAETDHKDVLTGEWTTRTKRGLERTHDFDKQKINTEFVLISPK